MSLDQQMPQPQQLQRKLSPRQPLVRLLHAHCQVCRSWRWCHALAKGSACSSMLMQVVAVAVQSPVAARRAVLTQQLSHR